jgi:hypothetical protein
LDANLNGITRTISGVNRSTGELLIIKIWSYEQG